MYTILFLVRYLPFWAIPASLMLFELGVYHYNRRNRIGVVGCYGLMSVFIVASILWLVFEGYWRAGPAVKKFLESYGF